MLTTVFNVCDRGLKLFTRGLDTIHQGFWLGVLSDTQLQQLTQGFYDRVARYGDPDFNASGLREWEQRLTAAHFAPGSRILVAAAGGGRELVGLQRAGFAADGFDCHPSYVEAGQKLLPEHGVESALVLSPPGQVPPQLGSYDGAIIGWGGYMHIRGRRARSDFLRDLIRHLPAGAPILVSVFHREELSRVHATSARLANVLRRVLGREPIDPGDYIDGSFDHHFTAGQLAKEFEDAGLSMSYFERVAGGYGVAIAKHRSVDAQDAR